MGLCSRRRKILLFLFLLLIPNLAAQTDPTVGGIALDPSLHERRRAPSLQSIIARSKPTAVWSDTDMLWIDRDTSGHPLFALNHAYQLDSADAHGSWALFDADPGYVAAGCQAVKFQKRTPEVCVPREQWSVMRLLGST